MDNFIGYGTIMQRVLGIPEIVELVFSFMDGPSNANNALVCRKWSEIALNLLWRDVSDVYRLFGLLAPLKTIGHSVAYITLYSFARSIEPSDWERFTRYARYVRTLSFDEGRAPKPLSTSAFDEVSRTRMALSIIPNLRELAWLAKSVERMRLSFLFMHESVTQFSVYLHRTESYAIGLYFKEVLQRMPHLQHLDLRFSFAVRDIEADLVQLLRGLRKLKRVVLPLFTLTSMVVEELSKLPNVGTIQFEFSETQGRGDVQDVMHFAPRLEQGAFPSLFDLSLSVNLPDFTNFLNGYHSPTNLTSLYIHVLSAAQPSMVTDFLTSVSENCQLLTHLYLDFLRTQSAGGTAPSREKLSWEALRPVLACPNLVAFELRWDRPLQITQNDIEELASKWPSLETLLLNCEPMDITEIPSLTLRALLPFARHCPKLEELGLFLSATAADIDGSLGTVKPFKSLKRLCTGLSSISETGPVALFLSQLCPLGCELSSGITWPEGFGIVETAIDADLLDELQKEAATWWEKWNEVGKFMPLLTKLRMEERENRKALEKEVGDLRTRCRLLSERAQLGTGVDSTCVAL